MPAIYIQEKLEPEEITALYHEFSQYDLLFECRETDWSHVEVLYGEELNEHKLRLASRLRWIHCPSASNEKLCMDEIKKRRNIVISLTKGQNTRQIAEFVLGGILAFAKQFFQWEDAGQKNDELEKKQIGDRIWSLEKKILLQVGLGDVGSAIVKQANYFGMKSWGLRWQRSFHPYCQKTFPTESLHSILPAVDIVVLALPKIQSEEILFGEEEFQLMKPDSIFIVVGSSGAIDEKGLANVAKTGKFRGVIVDATNSSIPKNSILSGIPNVILTPAVSSYPESDERISFRVFRTNLRLFTSGKIKEMKNLVAY